MNFAMGLQAVDEYFREGDRRKTREYQQALRDSELSLLPDRAESLRSGYRDSSEVNAARARLRPGETELSLAKNQAAQARQPDEAAAAAAELKVKASNAQLGVDQLPVTQETMRQNNLGARSEATFANDQRPVTQTTRALANSAGLDAATTTAAVAGQNREMIPQTLAKMQAQGALSSAEQSDAVLGTLARRLRSNDAAGALDFANQIAKIPGIMPNTNGKTFVSIEAVANGTDPTGQTGSGYVFKTDDGAEVFMSSKTMVDAYSRTLGNPKFEFLYDKDSGEVIRTNERTGDASVIRAGDPAARAQRNKDKMPAEERMIRYYQEQGMSFDEAERRNRTQKEPSRLAFIAKRLEMNPSPTPADVDAAGKMYDDLQTGKTRPAPSNSAAPGTVDPRFNSLLGIK